MLEGSRGVIALGIDMLSRDALPRGADAGVCFFGTEIDCRFCLGAARCVSSYRGVKGPDCSKTGGAVKKHMSHVGNFKEVATNAEDRGRMRAHERKAAWGSQAA